MAISSPFEATQKTLANHMTSLDGLRGLAILIVLIHNVGTSSGGYTAASALAKATLLLTNMGWVGVQLFFVLSGFLITGILIDSKNSKHPLLYFYMRRTLRIFPVYYATLLTLFIIIPALGLTPSWLGDSMHHQLWFWTYTYNWTNGVVELGKGLGHFWSLAVEEQFYLVWPLLVISFSRRNIIITCLIAIVGAAAFRLGLQLLAPDIAAKAAYTFTFARLDALAAGALLAILIRTESGFYLLKAYLPKLGGLTLVIILVIILLTHNFAPVTDSWGYLNQTIAAIFFTSVIYMAVSPTTKTAIRINKLFDLQALRSLGKYSYAIYIFHLPVANQCIPIINQYLPIANHSHLFAATISSLTVLIVSMIIALISWQLIEQPCLRLKKHFQ